MFVLSALLAAYNPCCVVCTFNVIFATEAFLESGEYDMFDFVIHLGIDRSSFREKILFVFIAVVGLVVHIIRSILQMNGVGWVLLISGIWVNVDIFAVD